MPHNLLNCRPVRCISVILACLLIFDMAVPAMARQAQAGPGLKIVILEGEGAINNIRQRTAREAIVQVEDENKKPVAGATVVFQLPSSGPSGIFADGSTMLTVTTDENGRAAALLRPNTVSGDFQIKVTASYQGKSAGAGILQKNQLPGGAGTAPGPAAKKGGSGKWIAILAIAGGSSTPDTTQAMIRPS